jgi:hypothetical protein
MLILNRKGSRHTTVNDGNKCLIKIIKRIIYVTNFVLFDSTGVIGVVVSA